MLPCPARTVERPSLPEQPLDCENPNQAVFYQIGANNTGLVPRSMSRQNRKTLIAAMLVINKSVQIS